MKKTLLAFLLLSLAGVIPLPAAKKESKLILEELQKLTEVVNALDKKITFIYDEFTPLAKKVEIIEERVGAVARSQADINQSKENTVLSLQFLKEELNEVKNTLGKINDRLLNLPSSGGTAMAASAGTETGSADASLPQDPSTLYYTAYSDYLKENFDLAVAGFRQYLRAFPESGLADNSLYWIGECFYAQKKYVDAVNTFNDLISRYQDGDKIPAALLKKGYALIEMGRQSEGIATLRELISRFPLQEEASLARQKIQENLE